VTAEVSQDTWLRVHRVRHTYRAGGPLLPWIFTFARRARVDHFRRNLPARIHEISSAVLPEATAPGDSAAMLPTFSMLMCALPAAQREVLWRLNAEGISIREVARATGSTPGAIKQNAHRAHHKLRHLLEPVRQREPRREEES
jgi:RNA polymerase sigma-70 factor, ECF subfamily